MFINIESMYQILDRLVDRKSRTSNCINRYDRFFLIDLRNLWSLHMFRYITLEASSNTYCLITVVSVGEDDKINCARASL